VSDNNPDLAAQEVDEDLRRDQLLALWKTYGKYIIGASVGIALIVGTNQIYTSQVRSAQERSAKAFEEATVAAAVEGADQIAIWEQAANTVSDGYSILTGIRNAKAIAATGDIAGAISAYDTVAADSNADEVLQDLARLQAAILISTDVNKSDEARSRFALIAVKGKPWYFSAMEQLAFLTMKSGNTEEALAKFSLLADDSDTPQSIKTRAAQFRSMLESKNVASEVSDSTETEGANSEG